MTATKIGPLGISLAARPSAAYRQVFTQAPAQPPPVHVTRDLALANGQTASNSTNNRGIGATDRTGALQLIVREGDPLDVAPGDFRTLSEVSFVGLNGNSNGWPSGLTTWASLLSGPASPTARRASSSPMPSLTFRAISTTTAPSTPPTWPNGGGTLARRRRRA